MEGDEALRQTIRQNLALWADKLSCGGDASKLLAYKMKFVKALRNLPIAIETDKANEQHYEVDTDFFKIVLGNRKKYSSCYYEDGMSLNQAEEAMLKIVCERAKLSDGMRVMDLGCGWGVTGLWICEKYPNSTVTCVSNSATQAKYIKAMAAVKGFSDRLECVTADANKYSPDLKYDRIISIEMFEHMKNYDQLMERVASWLQPNGYLFTQILCHRQSCYHFKNKGSENTEWMAKQFFSGGTMPSSDLFLYFQKDLTIEDHWNINGNHYSKTLEAWLTKLDANRDKVLKIFQRAHGNDAEKQVFNWRMFFIYCSEAFAFNGGNDWIVSQHLFKKNRNLASKL